MAVIPVFVSSTFRDFHRERDELNRTVLPVLNELVAPFGSRVELIDLRWGISAEGDDAQARHLRILDVCLAEIARAEPLFVGLIGERYGWVAPFERLERAVDEAGESEIPAGVSVTALEFEFGALRSGSQTALFFERDISGEVSDDWRDTDLSKVIALKRRVHQRCRVYPYRVDATTSSFDLSQFVATVTEHLGAEVQARARQLSATTIDSVGAATELFFEDRAHGFAGRTSLVDKATDIVERGSSVCLYGPSGAGKSAVWCATVSRLRSHGKRVMAIPVGVAPEVATLRGILLRICRDLGSTPDVSINPDELLQHTGELLGAAAPIVVAIDALDQLPDDARLTFFSTQPNGVQILTSTTLYDHVHYLLGAGFRDLTVPLMNAESTRAAVAAISMSIRRDLPPAAIDALALHERSPLWLRLAIAELLTLEAEDYVDVNPTADPLTETARVINTAVAALPSTTESLIDRLTGRAMKRYGEQTVRSVLEYCAVSRSGLRPLDIEQLVGIDALSVAGVRRALAPLLSPRREGGRLGFTHAIISAHIRRPIPDSEIERLHSELVAFMATVDDDPLCTDDRLWHAFRAPLQAPTVSALLARTTEATLPTICAVIIDSVRAPYFRSSLHELTPVGVLTLTSTAHRFKSESTASVRAELALALFDASRAVIDRGDTSPAAFSALSDAAGCLTDLRSVPGRDLLGATADARQFTRQQLEARPNEVSLMEAFALTTMAFVNESSDPSRLIDELEQACSAWDTVSERRPGLRADSWYQFALTLLGGAHQSAGNLDAARSAYLKAIPLAERVDSDPSLKKLNSHVNLVNLRAGLGEVAAAQGHNDEARDHFRVAVTIAQDQYTRNPDISASRDLARTAAGYGRTLLNLGENGSARQWLNYADQLARRLAKIEPDAAEWRFGAATAAAAAIADVIDGDYDSARERLFSYRKLATHRDEEFDFVALQLLHNARQNTRICESLAQLVVDVAALEGTPTEPGNTYTRADMHQQAAAQASANVSGDRDDTYGIHVPAVCDALELIAEQRASKDDPHWLDTIDEVISLRVRRLDGSSARDVTERARELGRALLLEASQLRGHDRAQAAANIALHWTTYLAEDVGNDTDNRVLARRLTEVAMNERAQADILFPFALRYASVLTSKFPEDAVHRFNYLGILDTWGAHQANTGHPEDAAATWLQAARHAGSPAANQGLTKIRNSIARNLRKISSSRAIRRSLRKECAAWANRLESGSSTMP